MTASTADRERQLGRDRRLRPGWFTSALTRTDIAFLFPPGGMPGCFVHHLGVAYIQAMLLRSGIRSTQVVPPPRSTVPAIVRLVLALEPVMVGIACYDKNFFMTRILADAIKGCRDQTVIVVGGPTATFSDRLLLEEVQAIDVCVRHEGEDATLDLATHLLGGGALDDLGHIAGVSFRQNGSVVRTPGKREDSRGGPPSSALDSLPSPYIEGVLDGTEGAGIITGRGCVHRCTFCSCSAMSRHSLRLHSVDRVIAELRQIADVLIGRRQSRRLRPPVVRIHDDAFSLDTKRAKELCGRIIDENLDLRLGCLSRADNLDDELIDLMAAAGFKGIEIGLESAVPRVLRGVRKVPVDRPGEGGERYRPEREFLDQVESVVASAKRAGLETSASIVLGLPGETLSDALETLAFVRRLKLDRYAHNVLIPTPGTELFDKRDSYGLEVEQTPSLLPYRLRPSYPVGDVPVDPGEHDWQLARRLGIKAVSAAFCGATYGSGEHNASVSLAVVEWGRGEASGERLRWLFGALGVGGKLVLLGSDGEDSGDHLLPMREGIAAGLPTKDVFVLNHSRVQREARHHGEAEYVLSCPDHPAAGARFLVRPMAVSRLGRVDTPGETRVYLVDCPEDLRRLAQHARKSRSKRVRCWHDRFLDGVILDGCRWGRGPCPAPRMKRLYIDAGGAVRPCPTGDAVGRGAFDLAGLLDVVASTQHETVTRRGCATCPVADWCSKCLFPWPLSEQAFCDHQQRSAELGRFASSTQLLHTYFPGVEDDF